MASDVTFIQIERICSHFGGLFDIFREDFTAENNFETEHIRVISCNEASLLVLVEFGCASHIHLYADLVSGNTIVQRWWWNKKQRHTKCDVQREGNCRLLCNHGNAFSEWILVGVSKTHQKVDSSESAFFSIVTCWVKIFFYPRIKKKVVTSSWNEYSLLVALDTHEFVSVCVLLLAMAAIISAFHSLCACHCIEFFDSFCA